MRLVENSVEEICENRPGKRAEFCGRICYNSISKITEDSYIQFLTNIIKSGHTTVLEHENFSVKMPEEVFDRYVSGYFNVMKDYSKFFYIDNVNFDVIITGNIRAWFNFMNSVKKYGNGYTDKIFNLLHQDYPYIFSFTEIGKFADEAVSKYDIENLPKEYIKRHKLYTFKIVASRAATHQAVRSRTMSFLQQSQRYCNFSAEKYGHSIDFIMPKFDTNLKSEAEGYSKEDVEAIYKENFIRDEADYFALIDKGLKPEDARAVLPNAAASVLMISGNMVAWDGFFNLRCDDHAQYEIHHIADMIKEKIYGGAA